MWIFQGQTLLQYMGRQRETQNPGVNLFKTNLNTKPRKYYSTQDDALMLLISQ